MGHSVIRYALLCGGLLAASAVSAGQASTQMLADTCVGCHGPDGSSLGPAIPSIAGMSPNYFVGAMLAYKYDNDPDKIESRPYRRGVLRGIEPRGRHGAWELALRYSTLDLNDQDVRGGQIDDWTLGLNWYVNENVRFMANYVRAQADPNRDGVHEEPEVVQVRAQVQF